MNRSPCEECLGTRLRKEARFVKVGDLPIHKLTSLPIRDAHKHFIVDSAKMAGTADAYFSHCLPLRRNVKATDEVVSGPRSLVIDEAENRLHVQKALLRRLIGRSPL